MWGSAYFLIDVALDGFSPFGITFARVTLALAFVASLPAARRGRVDRQDWPRVALLGVTWLALPLLLFPIAQQDVSSSVAGMLTGAQPVFSAGIAAVLLHRAPRRSQVLGLALGFAGVAVIVFSETIRETSDPLSIGLIVLAVLSYALSANVAVPLQQRYGALPVILRGLAVAAVIVTIPGLATLSQSAPSVGTVASLAALGVLSTGAGYLVFTTLLGRVGATRGAVAIYLVPVVAMALGAGVRGDRIATAAVGGVALVLVGAWLTGRRPGGSADPSEPD